MCVRLSSLHAGGWGASTYQLCTSFPMFRLSPLPQLLCFTLKSQQNQPGAQNRALTRWHEPPMLPNPPDAPVFCPSPQLRGVRGSAVAYWNRFCLLALSSSSLQRTTGPKLLDCSQTVLHIPSPSRKGLCFSAVILVLTPHLHNTFWNGPWGLVYARKWSSISNPSYCGCRCPSKRTLLLALLLPSPVIK